MMDINVWIGQNPVGILHHDAATNRFSFDYSAAWVGRNDAYPLCPALPLTAPGSDSLDMQSARTRTFFENLLPEGRALDDAAAAYKLSKQNIAGLLATLGHETAGAVRLCVGNQVEPGSKRRIGKRELSSRIRSRARIPFTVWDGKVRLSIAGFQDKLAVMEENGEWYLVEGANLASTHILKPEPLNPLMDGMVSNEFFCMRLAAAAKLNVAKVSLEQLPERVLSIERFDRIRAGSQIERMHAIDGCQLLGLPGSYKNERIYGDNKDVKDIRDGASLPKFFAALNQSQSPILQRNALLRWVIFQALIGNVDAHAKNLSFFMGADQLTLAPAYDLVCGKAFRNDHLATTYAMAIGDAFEAHDLSSFEWAQLCVQTNLPPAYVQQELTRLATALPKLLDKVAREGISEGCDQHVISPVMEVISAECKNQLALAKGIPDMMRLATESADAPQSPAPTAAG